MNHADNENNEESIITDYDYTTDDATEQNSVPSRNQTPEIENSVPSRNQTPEIESGVPSPGPTPAPIYVSREDLYEKVTEDLMAKRSAAQKRERHTPEERNSLTPRALAFSSFVLLSSSGQSIDNPPFTPARALGLSSSGQSIGNPQIEADASEGINPYTESTPTPANKKQRKNKP